MFLCQNNIPGGGLNTEYGPNENELGSPWFTNHVATRYAAARMII